MQNEQYNRDFLEFAGIESKNSAFTGPEHVVIDITNSCNNNCIGCWTESPLLRDKAPGQDWKNRYLPFSVLKKLIEGLKEIGVQRIRLTGGGEPSTHPDFKEIVRFIKSHNFILNLTTNFTLFDKHLIDILLELKMDNISISLWAGSSVTYSRIHLNKTEATFRRITENIRYLIANRKNGRPEIIILNVLNNLNFHELQVMLDYGFFTGIDGMYFTLMDPVKDRTEGLLISRQNQKKLLEQALLVKKMVEEHVLKGNHFFLDNFDLFLSRIEAKELEKGSYDRDEIDRQPCLIGWHFCRILADGRVVPCCRGVKHSLGNIKDQEFKEIWFSEKYNKFREMALSQKKGSEFFKTFDCYSSCDNLMHNKMLFGRFNSRSQEEREKTAIFLKEVK